MPVPNTFANATATIPLSQLDANFATTITLGNTAIQLGNTVSTLNNMTLANVTVTSGNVTLTNVTVTTANVTTANTTTLVVTGNTTLGDASTDTVTVNGYVGVGGAASASRGVYVQSTALTGTTQSGVVSALTGSSAATSNIDAFRASPASAAASFTVTNMSGLRITDATKGAGSTISSQYGILIDDQTQGTSDYGIASQVSSGTDKWNIYASGTAANYFAGNVGIGTSAPTEKLTLGAAGKIQVLRSDNARGGEFFADNTGTHLTALASGNDPLFLEAIGTGSVRVTTNATERMRIDSSGNVGIGTSSPSRRLVVAASGTAARLEVINTSDSDRGGYLRDTGSTFEFGSNSGVRPLAFAPDGTERARIDTSGNLLVGSTSSPATARTYLKGASATSSDFALLVQNSANTDMNYVRNDGLFSTGTASQSPYNKTTASAANVFVDSGGVLNRSTSSIKYKQNVKDAVHGLSDLLNLRAVTYEGKSEEDAGKTFGGLIAEEVHNAGLNEFVQYADDGSPDALAYGNMVSLCIKAIQEQQQMIETLQAKVAALEGKK